MSEKNQKKDKNIFEPNGKYFTICIYGIVFVLAASIVIRIAYNWEESLKLVSGFLSHLSSFLAGILMAFMLNPLVHYMNYKVFTKVVVVKNQKAKQFLSIFSTYLIVFGFLTICMVYVIPQLAESISQLSEEIPTMYIHFTSWLRTFAYKNDFINSSSVNRLIAQISPKIMEFSANLASKVIPWIYTASVSLIRVLVTFVIAIIISIYLLIDKKYLAHNMKRFLYAFFSEDTVRHSLEIIKNCSNIFTGYIIAKAIDSLIIGVICFFLMIILKLPYAVLVSVIVGITNMIPYFGPYIGAIPGAFILSVSKIKYGIIFLIMVVVLQQFDGLILGPRLLGDSTGLRPILILFAITLGGAYFGVVGMFLGVPVVAVIQYLLNLVITKRLKARGVDTDKI